MPGCISFVRQKNNPPTYNGLYFRFHQPRTITTPLTSPVFSTAPTIVVGPSPRHLTAKLRRDTFGRRPPTFRDATLPGFLFRIQFPVSPRCRPECQCRPLCLP